jgi:uncharacterized protein
VKFGVSPRFSVNFHEGENTAESPLGRVLFFILIGIAIWLLWRGSMRVGAAPPTGDASRTAHGEDMVQCARCGVHLPRSEAREEGGRLVCRDNPRCRSA